MFALKRFAKNETVAPYPGRVLNQHQVNEMYGRSKNDLGQYAVQMSNNSFMDGACARGIAGYSNWKAGTNNSKLAVNHQTKAVSIKASKVIPEGTEIFTAYGKNYWAKTNTLPKPVYSTEKRKVAAENPTVSKHRTRQRTRE